MEQKKKEMIIAIISIIIFVGFCYLILHLIKIPKGINNICVEFGHRGALDYSKGYCDGSETMRIQCDEVAIYEVEIKKNCIQKNKWGDCIKLEENITNIISKQNCSGK